MTSLTDEPLGDLFYKRILAIGGTGGLGRALSLELANHGATVTVVGRTFRDNEVKNINFVEADLSSIANSTKTAEELVKDADKYDIVLFTTGIFASRTREETEEGIEKDLAVSFLNRVRILDVLTSKLKRDARVFVFGFPGNGQLGVIDDLNSEKSYQFWTAHMNTVACNEALVVDSAKKFDNLKFYGVNPGLVKTNIRGNLLGDGMIAGALESILGYFNPTPEQYAKTLAPALLSSKLNDLNGVHIDKNGKLLPGSKGMTQDHAAALMEKSRELISSIGST